MHSTLFIHLLQHLVTSEQNNFFVETNLQAKENHIILLC
jgi:hypothetical protein